MEARIQKWGDSLVLRIPESFATGIHLEQGTLVEMSLRDGRLVVEPVHPSPVTLEDLLKDVTPENLHDEIDTGRQWEEKCGRGVHRTSVPLATRSEEPAYGRTVKEHGNMKRSYFVTAVWDADAQVFYSESDIKGLHIEADTLEAFEALVVDLAPDLIIENHLSPFELGTTPLREMIPSIVIRRPNVVGSLD